MSVKALKENNHRYSIDIPDKIYTALKVNATVEKESFKDIILSSFKEILGEDVKHIPVNEQRDVLSFTEMSAKMFAEEWNSEDDDKAFNHLQKYKKMQHS